MKESKLFKLTILGTSDVHGLYQAWDYSIDVPVNKGGLSRVSTVFKKLKAENENTMIIDCGDLIQGNSAEVFLDRKDFPGMLVANHIGYEIYNMGNHEFNFGMEKLFKVVSQFNGAVMMGNLYDKKGKRQMKGFYVKDFGPVKIGFISLNTPLVKQFEEKRGNLKNYDVRDADEELRLMLKGINTEELDALIGIFHMGDINENNIDNTGVRDLIYNVEGATKIDAIFGGHMHRVVPSMMIKNTVFVQPGSRAEAVNRLDLTFDLEKKKKLVEIKPSIIMIDDRIESDPEVEAILKPFHEELRAYSNEHIGYVEGPDLRPEDKIKGIPQTWVSQTPVTDFFLDVMLYYSKADVVATHMDNPYPTMPSREIKRKHIYNSYRYSGGDICNYKVRGRELRAYMEWSAGFFNQSKQGDITISINKERANNKYSTFDIFGNIKYEIDLSKPMGARVRNVRYMDDRPILEDEFLILGINKYRMDFLTSEEGPLYGKAYQMVWASMTDERLGVRGTIRDLAMKYFQELDGETYVPKENLRWKILTHNMHPNFSKSAIDLINEGIVKLPLKDDKTVDLTVSKNLYDLLTDEEMAIIIDRCSNCSNYLSEGMTLIDLIFLLEDVDLLKK